MLDTLRKLLKVYDDDVLLSVILKQATADFHDLTNNDAEPENIIVQMAIVRYNLLKTEGLSSQSFNGLSESYEGYGANLLAAIKRYRKAIFV